MDTTNGPDDGAEQSPDQPAGPASAGQGGLDDWSTSPASPQPAVPSPGLGAGEWQSWAGAPPPEPSRRPLLLGIAAGAGGVVVLGVLLFALWPDSGTGDDTGGPAASTSSPPVTPSETETAVQPTVTVANRSVPATQVWTAMGVGCETGDVLDIAMSGSASHDQTPGGTVGPTGLLDPRFHQYNVEGFPDANTMTIIGSLDEDPDTFFVVGEAATYVCPQDGELRLGVNDVGVQNNSGAFEATITRTTHG